MHRSDSHFSTRPKTWTWFNLRDLYGAKARNKYHATSFAKDDTERACSRMGNVVMCPLETDLLMGDKVVEGIRIDSMAISKLRF